MIKVMSSSRLRRGKRNVRAFTLVEVLVSLVLVSILSGMILTAVRGVTSTARQSRTRSIIAIIDSVIQEQYESYKYRPLPVVVPDITPNNTTIFGYEVMPSEGARVRLNMIRDLQRMELPDRATDILMPDGQINGPADITVAVSPIVRVVDPMGVPRMVREIDKNRRESAVVSWAPSAKLEQYRRRLAARTLPVNLINDSAECLYMIMATSFIGGTPAVSLIPSQNLGDTDLDGLPEILDGWGRPIGFVRWPTGYSYSFAEESQNRSVPDDFDLMKSDFGWIVNEQMTPSDQDIVNPWSVRPLVISAGSDGEFGIRFAPEDASDNPIVLRYRESVSTGLKMTWPLTSVYMGPESQGRLPLREYVFVDPFFRNAQLFAGVNLPASNKGDISFQDDNITNYQATVTE